MTLWARRFVTLMLAVFLTAGLSMTAVQASSMPIGHAGDQTMKISMASHGMMSRCPDLQDCGGAGKSKAMTSGSICSAPGLALISEDAPTPVAVPINSKRLLPKDELVLGGVSPAVPCPPPTTDLG